MQAVTSGPQPTRTTCPYCGVGCGIVAMPGANGTAAIKGDPDHPANFGRLCSKGAALGETLSAEGRLLYPTLRGERVDWDTALSAAASGIERIGRQHGPDAVAFYVSGQLLTEDYYVANKLMKGFIGSANIDSNSRLCMASSVAGHRRAFGADTVPVSYEDLEEADLVVLAGSNLAWCHPVLYQRLLAARKARPSLKVVLIDPRRTATGEIADLHLAIRPGMDALLFNGLLLALARAGRTDRAFVHTATAGLEEALAAARASAGDETALARRLGVARADLRSFYRLFALTDRVVTVYSQGINQSASGTDKVNAIINCHLLTGRIGRPGAGPFSVTGQPNAMGGREVGALANQLAAHMDFARAADVDRVRRFWKAPLIASRPGLKAVDMFRAVEAGRIKALWIMATNPVVSLPDAESVRRALGACELVIVSDCTAATDTAGYAHLLLPAAAWGEKEGTVTNSERRISRQRAFLAAPGEARPDWWIVSEVARRLGHGEAFSYRSAADVFREHAALSAFENDGTRDFDLGGLARIDDAAYDALAPIRWPIPAGGRVGRKRFFGDGRFFTEDGRARLVAVTPEAPVHAPGAAYPLILNTGRTRDHWHTMSRTGRSPSLSRHEPRPSLDMHPEDAAQAGLADGDLAVIDSAWGSAMAWVRIDRAQRPGAAFAAMHWNGQFASRAGINAVVNPDCDPVSGQPELKHTPVGVRRLATSWRGLLLSRLPMAMPDATHWSLAARAGYWRYEIAGSGTPAEAWATVAERLRSENAAAEWIEYRDAAAGQHRGAALRADRLAALVFIAPAAPPPCEDRFAAMFEERALTPGERHALLATQAGTSSPEPGAIVCACFGVGRFTILRAAIAHGLITAEAVGARLRAGTNCGSCLPEIRALLAAAPTETAA